MRLWGSMGMNTAAGTKNSADGAFLSRIVNRTIGRGRGRVLVPVGIMVSDLETRMKGNKWRWRAHTLARS
jgi:hypothetical protein